MATAARMTTRTDDKDEINDKGNWHWGTTSHSDDSNDTSQWSHSINGKLYKHDKTNGETVRTAKPSGESQAVCPCDHYTVLPQFQATGNKQTRMPQWRHQEPVIRTVRWEATHTHTLTFEMKLKRSWLQWCPESTLALYCSSALFH